jgi:opacity protein-like surface antigen
MRRLALLAAATAVLLFAFAVAAQARVVSNEQVPFETAGGSLCGGEGISFGGTAHTVITSTVDQAGGTHWVMHTNWQKTTAVGESGAQFVIRQVENSGTNIRPLDPEETTNYGESTFIIHGRLIRLGEDGTQSDDTLIHIMGHITQAATGEITTQFDKVVFQCS